MPALIEGNNMNAATSFNTCHGLAKIQTRTRVRLAVIFACILILSTGFASFAVNSTSGGIKYSFSSSRINKELLDGAMVKGNIYVVMTGSNIKAVSFSIDGQPVTRTDTRRPFDYIGSKNSKALAFNTTKLSDGSHTIRATLNWNKSTYKEATFVIRNNQGTTTTTKPTTTTTTNPTTTTTTRPSTTTTTLPPELPIGNTLAGVTIDNPWNVSQVVSSLDQLKSATGKTITARVVFDAESDGVKAKDYAEITPSIHAKHPVMGELIDSFYVKKMTVEQYRARAQEYFSTLKSSVDIWEIGNEVNGEWVGDPAVTAQKLDAAYGVIGSSAPTALTLHCDREADDMYEFSRRLSANTRSGIDYIFVSQYDADCIYTGAQHAPDQSDSKGRLTVNQWANRFASLSELYPNASVGFGEVGIAEQLRSSTSATTQAEVISYYYGLGRQIMPILQTLKPNTKFAGGYFYWYYSSDSVPYNKNVTITTTLAQSIRLL